jgi:hypothetical protein
MSGTKKNREALASLRRGRSRKMTADKLRRSSCGGCDEPGQAEKNKKNKGP